MLLVISVVRADAQMPHRFAKIVKGMGHPKEADSSPFDFAQGAE